MSILFLLCVLTQCVMVRPNKVGYSARGCRSNCMPINKSNANLTPMQGHPATTFHPELATNVCEVVPSTAPVLAMTLSAPVGFLVCWLWLTEYAFTTATLNRCDRLYDADNAWLQCKGFSASTNVLVSCFQFHGIAEHVSYVNVVNVVGCFEDMCSLWLCVSSVCINGLQSLSEE